MYSSNEVLPLGIVIAHSRTISNQNSSTGIELLVRGVQEIATQY